MKRWQSIIFLFLLLLLSGCGPDAIDMYDRPITLSNYKGKWIVINYWTTWCAPCIQEISALNTLAKYYKDDVIVFGVNPDNLNPNVLMNLTDNYHVHYLFLRSFRVEKWGGKVRQLPVTFILDRKGRLYKTLQGPQTLQNLKAIMNLPEVTYN
jgi:thiol-disulfide isomerase/thioredoxin